MKLDPTTQPDRRETAATRAVARDGKPLGYTWRLWNDPRGPGQGRHVLECDLNRTHVHPLLRGKD